MSEMVRVRVLFLKEGDTAHKTDFDGCLIEEIGTDFYSDDVEHEYWRLDALEMAEALKYGYLSPSDPAVSILKPVTLVYFDLLTLNSDWHGSGSLGESVDNVGLWETFHDWLPQLVAHASTLRPSAKKARLHYDAPGDRVQFYTMWNCWCYAVTTADGHDWEQGHELIGTWNHGEVAVTPIVDPASSQARLEPSEVSVSD